MNYQAISACARAGPENYWEDDIVHEADLCPNVANIATTMSRWKPTSHWHVVDWE